MSTNAVPLAHIVAMHNRFKQLALTQAWLGKSDGLKFAQGGMNALAGFIDGVDYAQFAERDHSMRGYQPLAGFEAAWATLPDAAERFTLAQMQQHLATHGVELAGDSITNSNVNATQQLKNGPFAMVNGHNKHDALGADFDDGASLHESSTGSAAIVLQGEVAA